jgi:hypothetical protein
MKMQPRELQEARRRATTTEQANTNEDRMKVYRRESLPLDDLQSNRENTKDGDKDI